MGIDLRRDMHVRARRSGARGVVLRHWRHTNGHIWAEVRFVNGDTATVRSTHLERITLTEEEQRELSSQSAGSLTDPLELMQRTIDRSIKVTGDCGTEITNAFDEILKPDGTPLTEVELRTERGKPVVDEPLDEEKAKRKAQAAREGRQTTRSRQLEVRYAGEHEPGVVIISCNVCRRRGASRHEWRVALDSNGVMDGTALHKIRSHCGQFASVRHASTLEHCVALGRLTGRVFSQRASDASRLPAKRSYKAAVPVVRKQATTTPSRPAKRSRPSKRALAAEEAAKNAPRLQIHDGRKFVDLKKDAGRSVRYHRLARRLQSLLKEGNHAVGVTYPVQFRAPRSTSDRCLELARLLLTKGLVAKVPVAKAADVQALRQARLALEQHPQLCDIEITSAMDTEAHALALDETRVRRIERMALLFVAHQLWTPARVRRFASAVNGDDADDALRDVECAKAACRDADALLAWLASDEALRSEDSERLQAWRASLDDCPVRCDLDTPSPRPPTALDPAWDAPSSAANRCRRALQEAEVGRDEARHREAALENDVFTGRHKTKTTPSAVLQAGWTRKWRDAQKVAEVFVEVFENARQNEHTINDSACMLLVRAARGLPDVGAYIGAHLVRSLLAVHDLTLPLDAWGPFTMSDDSVGQMRELLGDAVCSTPMQLRVALAQELGSLEVDAGDLALILCETHSCWALACRHAQHHASWNHDALLQALRDTPVDWAVKMREVLLDEYHLPFDPSIVYHPAHKLLLVTMVAKGLHDVNVLRMAPPSSLALPRPVYRVWAPGDSPSREEAPAPEPEEEPAPPAPAPSAFSTMEDLAPMPPVPTLAPTLGAPYGSEMHAGSGAAQAAFSI